MAYRVFLALVGAVIITAGMLLGMRAVTSLFEQADYHRYYRITDVFARPWDQRPDRPEDRPRPPPSPALTSDVPDSDVPVPPPRIENPAPLAPASLPAPAIEPPEPPAPGR